MVVDGYERVDGTIFPVAAGTTGNAWQSGANPGGVHALSQAISPASTNSSGTSSPNVWPR
jgi:hypothetical protein